MATELRQTISCPVDIFLNDQPVTAEQLTLNTRDSTSFVLTVASKNSTNLSNSPTFYFIPSIDLIGRKDGHKNFTLNASKNCHFESVDDQKVHSALSTCSSNFITGILRSSKDEVYVLSHDNSGFYVIPQNSYNCAFSAQRRKRAIPSNPPKTPEYYLEFLDDVKRYVELIFIADNSIYVKYDKNEEAIHDRMHSIANVVNSLYSPLNIRITLVWADIWKDADPFEVTIDSDSVLNSFLRYRKDLLAQHPHDNAHLLTDIRFGNRVIGKAFRGTMCSYDFSGGVIVNDDRVAFTGSTVAHEMGHNFGMEHDAGYPDPCKCEANMCIMAPSSGSTAPTTYWSDCSLEFLQHALKRGTDYCLQNVPKTVFGGAKCGNGVVEDGEECDCGSTTTCPNRCCIAAECRLAPEAQCADGDCCDTQTCKPMKMATVCRKAMNSCDLPEFCDGENPSCPPDFFVQNGLSCPDYPEDFCYEGYCGSRDKQCKMIWGETGRDAVEDCYRFNQYGSAGGNCGFDNAVNLFKRCDKADVECGRLQCFHLNERPEFGDPSSVFSSYQQVRLSSGKEVACRSIRTTYFGGKHADPGMVPDGAHCGNGRMCYKNKCANKTAVVEMVSKCDPTNCHDRGLCNNVGNCHCEIGYGGTACDIPGYGGSVNSGPASDSAFNPGLVLLYLSIVALIAFIVATIHFKRKHNIWIHKKFLKSTREALKIQSVLVPVRAAPPPPGGGIPFRQPNAFEAFWHRISHPGTPQHSTQHHQPNDVLTVRAAMPVIPQSYLPTAAAAPHTATAMFQQINPMPYNQPPPPIPHHQYERPPADPAPTHKRSNQPNRRPIVSPPTLEHRHLNGDHSPSSDEGNPVIAKTPRPQQPPPPPPPHQKTPPKTKPKPPAKPPVSTKTPTTVQKPTAEEPQTATVRVKDLAAKFNAKTTSV